MGYSTDFSGVLTFKKELTGKQIAKIQTFLGADCREHPEWGKNDLTWIDLEFAENFEGLQWNGSEKTYDLVKKVNLITEKMRQEFPDFEMEGELLAQGEETGDVWKLVMINGVATKQHVDFMPKGSVCPHCGGKLEF